MTAQGKIRQWQCSRESNVFINQTMPITWKIKHFKELTTDELYSIFHLRIAVFIVEQNCPFQDADGKDQESFHLMGFDEVNEFVAYARILPAGYFYKEPSIGRVATSPKARGTGTGKELMQNAIEFIEQKFGNIPIRIGAQRYLIKFYSSFGFVVEGQEYLEDNIWHVEMVRK